MENVIQWLPLLLMIVYGLVFLDRIFGSSKWAANPVNSQANDDESESSKDLQRSFRKDIMGMLFNKHIMYVFLSALFFMMFHLLKATSVITINIEWYSMGLVLMLAFDFIYAVCMKMVKLLTIN